MTERSVSVGSWHLCAHNGWQPSKEPCAECTALFAGVPTVTMRIYANAAQVLDAPYSVSVAQWYCGACRTIHVFKPGEPRVCGVCPKH